MPLICFGSVLLCVIAESKAERNTDTARMLLQCKHKGTRWFGKVKGSQVRTQYSVDLGSRKTGLQLHQALAFGK